LKHHRLSKRDARLVASLLREQGYPVSMEDEIELLEEGDVRIYAVGRLAFLEHGGKMLPLLDETINREPLSMLPSIIIDMGAVPHIANGADVMRPGVKGTIGEFQRDAIVAVRDERHHKAIALARALVASMGLQGIERGRVAENLHYVGDKKWRVAKRMLGRT